LVFLVLAAFDLEQVLVLVSHPPTKEKFMKVTVQTLKPRNPFVAASLQRKAGSHRPSTGAMRQREQGALRREIERLKHSP
jgi:hypothetical protein